MFATRALLRGLIKFNFMTHENCNSQYCTKQNNNVEYIIELFNAYFCQHFHLHHRLVKHVKVVFWAVVH